MNPLTVAECRKILGDYKSTDEEIQELLDGIRLFCNKFLDNYFAEAMAEARGDSLPE